LAGCFEADPGTSTGGGTGGGGGGGGTGGGTGGGDDGADGQALPGHNIQCCYGATTEMQFGGTQIVNVCENEFGQGYGCIDPTQYDADLDGTLKFDEMKHYCNAKCAWIGQKYTNDFPWFPEPGNEVEWANSDEVYGCLATPSTNIRSMNTCMPIDPEPYGSPAELVPTQDFAGSTTDQGNSVKIDVNGNSLTLDATLQANFALYDCDQGGIDGGRCSFVFTRFDLSLDSPVTSGGYVVNDASLSLAQRDEATVVFQSCVRGKCTGSFEMSPSKANALGVDFMWTQQHVSTGSTGHGGLNLSHEPGALGGLGSVIGTLVLEQASPIEGDLRLQATGSDAFGGSIAQVEIDFTGVVSRF